LLFIGKKNGGELTKSVKGFFKNSTHISTLQASVKDNTKRIEELNTQIYIANAVQMALAYCAPDAIFVNNEKGEVIFVNPAWLSMTGMPTAKDAYGFGYLRVIHKESLDFVKENTKSLIEHPGSFDNYIIFQHYHTRAKITTLCRSEPIFDDKGVLQKTIGRLTVISVEEYKKAG
jgi:PAS domain S-box-containing protein